LEPGHHCLPHLAAFLIAVSTTLFAEENTSIDSYVGSRACLTCHAGIYKSYSETPMGHASGKVGDAALHNASPGEFFHALSGVRYRVFSEQGDSYFEFRKNTSPAFSREIQGRRRLDYFIGSGAHARGYLSWSDGFLFQAPISYYSARGGWDMAPGYESHQNIFLGRLIEEECLECHASRLRPVKGMPGRYEAVPFQEGAISCERCHGPGKAHIARMISGGSGTHLSVVNPIKLEARRRDSVCAQCHLTGDARIATVRHSPSTFRPGDLLSDHVVSFVWSSGISQELKVIDHFEGLWNSRCKRVSADRLWCGTCHDPHSVPSPAQRAEFFRQKCLSCHQVSSCRSTREQRAKSVMTAWLATCRNSTPWMVSIPPLPIILSAGRQAASRVQMPEAPSGLSCRFGPDQRTSGTLLWPTVKSQRLAKNPKIIPGRLTH
jgi:predicted CXXCH cytochrome family protein